MTTRPHGTRAKYSAEKCRCAACTAANTAYANAYQRGQITTVDAQIIRDRIQTLLNLGWSLATLAAHTGYTRGGLHHILTEGKRVKESTALDILSIPMTAPVAAA